MVKTSECFEKKEKNRWRIRIERDMNHNGQVMVIGNKKKRVAVTKARREERSPSHEEGQRGKEKRAIRTWRCSLRC